jgi:hypothetical protein
MLDGTQEATSATDGTFKTKSGNTEVARNTAGFDGRVASFIYWDTNLDDTVMAAMARGVSPFPVLPGNQQYYLEYFGNASPEGDFSGNGFDATMTGSPAKAPHAPVELLENYL